MNYRELSEKLIAAGMRHVKTQGQAHLWIEPAQGRTVQISENESGDVCENDILHALSELGISEKEFAEL